MLCSDGLARSQPRRGYATGSLSLRTGTVGEPTPQQRDSYQALHAIHTAVIDRLAPGVQASSLYDLSQALCASHGHALPLPHVGHSTGLSLQEWPKFHSRAAARLRTGMVCVVVHVLNVPTLGRLYLEDVVGVSDRAPVELSLVASSGAPYRLCRPAMRSSWSEWLRKRSARTKCSFWIPWARRKLAVPLAQLEGIKADRKTVQAIEDWHYWTKKGYA